MLLNRNKHHDISKCNAPDNFIFEGSKESVRKQIGMAVPPEAAKVIVETVLKTFAGISYKDIQPKLFNGPIANRNTLFPALKLS